MANVLYLCLFGLPILPLVFCQDSQAEQKLPVYVNISDNATFHIQTNESQRIHDIEVIRIFGNIRRKILRLHSPYPDWKKIYKLPYDIQYHDRVVSVTIVNITAGLRILYLTIADIQPDDNGTYIIHTHSRYPAENGTCFILYVLGQPVVNTSVSPTLVQEGNSGHLKCLTTSTTVPASHHLTMFVSWSINGQLVETTGRYRAENNILTIYSMTRADDGLLVECEVREDEGLTTRANMSMMINWGPDPGLSLQPSKTYYHIEVGKTVPDIRCSADCKPECKIFWKITGNGSIVSTNGLLSLGSITENTGTFREYVCTATRQGTYNQASKSIFILLQERKGIKDAKNDDAAAIAATGVAVSTVALLLSIGVVILLLRQKMCIWKCHTVTEKEGTAEESTTQTRFYEDLKGTRDTQESYDAVNLGTFDSTEDKTLDKGTRDGAVYENSKMN